MSEFDVVVLGGGIIGCSIAEELARSGQRVCIVERSTIGSEASTAAAGILSAQMDVPEPGPFFDLCQASKRMYRAWVRRIERASSTTTGYHIDGILYLAADAAERRVMARRAVWQRRQGLRAEEWSPRETLRREPSLTKGFAAGFHFAEEGQVDNPQLMVALARACHAARVELREETVVTGVRIVRRAVAGVDTNRGRIDAPIVVACRGGWSSQSVRGLPTWPVVPAKGQILEFIAPPRLFRAAVMAEAAYGVQRRDGRLLVGSTIEFVGYDKRVTAAALHRILTGFAGFVRHDLLERCHLRSTWAGLRPHCQDGNPIIGATSTTGLFAATGHFRHGILLAPATAVAIRELITRGRSSYDLAPFSPLRFR